MRQIVLFFLEDTQYFFHGLVHCERLLLKGLLVCFYSSVVVWSHVAEINKNLIIGFHVNKKPFHANRNSHIIFKCTVPFVCL